MINLALIGMEKGRQYETIITTKNSDGSKNAAPIGVICAGNDKIINRIFKGSHTLENIMREKDFTVNITHDPELFTISTLENLPQDYFNDDYSIKGVKAYFKCEVTGLTEAVKQSDPIKKKDEAIVIKSQVVDLIINEDIKALNRAFSYVIESLDNLTGFDLVDDVKRQEYLNRFREAYRVVLKVGRKEDILAIREIKKELINKGFDL
ncbi:DUF447 domain-containing protein [Methanobrevibacter sp.]